MAPREIIFGKVKVPNVAEIAELIRAGKREELFERNLPLVMSVAKRHTGNSPTDLAFEDLFQEGSMGLLRATRRASAERAMAFSSFAFKSIERQILKAKLYWRYERYRKLDRPLQHSLPEGCREEPCLPVSDDPVAKAVHNEEVSQLIQELLRNAEPLEVDVLVRHFLHGHSLTEIAVDNGYCREHIRQKKESIWEKLTGRTMKEFDGGFNCRSIGCQRARELR